MALQNYRQWSGMGVTSIVTSTNDSHISHDKLAHGLRRPLIVFRETFGSRQWGYICSCLLSMCLQWSFQPWYYIWLKDDKEDSRTRGNKYLIVTVDAFIKYAFLQPEKTTCTVPVTNFLEQVINVYGAPRRLIGNLSIYYSSKSFVQFCKDAGIQFIYTAVSTP